IQTLPTTRLRISKDTAINAFNHNAFKYDRKGISPILFFNFADRLHVGLAYKTLKHKWRRNPFAYQHRFAVHYSINQGAFNILYAGIVNEFVGKWNLQLNAHYDFVRWTNFFGIGNETDEFVDDRDYYRMRTRDALANIGLTRRLGGHSALFINGFFQSIDVIHDQERFLSKEFSIADKKMYDRKNFSGAEFRYTYQHLNDMVVPTKGAEFSAGIRYTQNLQQKERSVTRYEATFNFFVPVLKRLVLAVRNGAATLSGEPEFYQLNPIGGSFTLRGYRRDRFWGKTAVYNSNELQWLFDFKSRLFNGKAGVVGLVDNGRVWQPGEESQIWHTAVGGGILLAPFNKLAVTITYAKAPKDAQINLRIGRSFK
ncbi:MAG TPA: BamA/TamA family outer membrane protein, partial [Chitinophagaceae bacterium]|nr:BamA/TamA family outer membrane protein [Chitinophagaceae bacterium]